MDVVKVEVSAAAGAVFIVAARADSSMEASPRLK